MTTQFEEPTLLQKVKHVIVGGVRTACLSCEELEQLMVEDCLSRRNRNDAPALIFDSNGHGLSLAATSCQFREDLAHADIIHADGGVIVKAANSLTNGHIGGRSATTDFMHNAAKAAVLNGLSFYLFGGTEEVNAKCAEILENMYPGLRIVGRRNGYFTPEEEGKICAEISNLKPDIVWVGLGKPKEQRFCVQNRDKISAGWLLTCGGCYNYITGDYKRAPMWMQNNGLEWVHRMLTKPKQLLWRYLTTTPHALFLIITRTQKNLV